jgi:hypothetical protein
MWLEAWGLQGSASVSTGHFPLKSLPLKIQFPTK